MSVRKLLSVCLFFLLLIVLLVSYLGKSKDLEERIALFSSFTSPRISTYSFSKGYITGFEMGNKVAPKLLFIHGSPGDASAWHSFLQNTDLTSYFHLLVVDRPGYGHSDSGAISLVEQREALHSLMLSFCTPCTIVGHSYGGALALELGRAYPKQVTRVISIAGTISPSRQHPRWYNGLASYMPLLPAHWQQSNDEMLRLSQDLSRLYTTLPSEMPPVTLLQGGKDVLVNSLSPFDVQSFFTNLSLQYRSEKNHFLPWTDHDWLMELFLQKNETPLVN